MYDYDVLRALGTQAPAGAIAWDRAPFWTVDSAAMNKFVSQYKAAYGSYPNEFAIIGYTAVQAINEQDLPLIMGIVLVASAAVVIANLVVDIFYAVLDPRVRIH